MTLALIGAVVAGSTMAVAAGARRTASAPDRFAHAHAAADVLVPNYPDPGAAVLDPDAITAHPAVNASARFLWTYWMVHGEGVALVVPRDRALGTTLSVPRIIEGRPAHPGRVDEVTVSFDLADRFGLELGEELVGVPADVIPEMEAAGLPTRVTLVGIEARPLEVGQAPPAILALHGTPALYERWHAADPEAVDGVAVDLHGGEGGAAAFAEHLDALAGPDTYVSSMSRNALSSELNRTARLLAGTLWVVAVVLAIAGVVLLFATHARAIGGSRDDDQPLSALGWTRRESMASAAWRSLTIGLASALVGVLLAVGLSPLFPLGLAGVAEPASGVSLDGAVLAVGAVLTIVATVAIAVLAEARADAVPVLRTDSAPRFGRWWLAGPALLGARFVVAGGVRRLARMTAATVAALVLLTTLAAIAASAEEALSDTRTYGWPWQLVAEGYEEPLFTPPDSAAGQAAIRQVPGVVAGAVGDITDDEDDLIVNGHGTGGFLLDAVRGDTAATMPPVTAGRLPTHGGEIALGPALMEQAGVQIGDTVTVSTEEIGDHEMTVVGEVVIPASVGGGTGGGVLLPRSASLERIGTPPGDESAQTVLLVLEPGAEPDDVLADLNRRLGATSVDRLYARAAAEPSDTAHLLRASSLPWLLAVILAVLALATLVTALVASTMQRARDVAVFRVLGMGRRASMGMLVSYAVAVAAFAIAVAIPIGVIAGRWLWILYADRQGFLHHPTIPWTALILGALTLVGIAALAALAPSHTITSVSPTRWLHRE